FLQAHPEKSSRTRILTTFNLHNDPGVADKDVALLRDAAARAAGLLFGDGPLEVLPGTSDTAFVLDLPSTPDGVAAWRTLLTGPPAYPYAVQFAASPSDAELNQAASRLLEQARYAVPLVRADWFVAAVHATVPAARGDAMLAEVAARYPTARVTLDRAAAELW